ncbi:MAG: zinc ribbon domain-containing protein [Actinomycetota bacterium]
MPTDNLAVMAMQLDDALLGRLLELQAEDTAIARLEDRRTSLPEAARLQEVSDHLAELAADLEIATKQYEEISREQARLEGEIGLAEQKLAREEQRLFSGAVSNPKELGALQAEVEMLKRQRATLEDGLLEVMVHRDQAGETVGSLTAERQTFTDEGETLRAAVAKLTGEIDAELAERGRARAALLEAGFPAELLALYDQLRQTKHGVGAAALQGSTCQGCHTKLPAKEVERLRSERGLQRCDNCRRILVVV